jgi:hypothetical protein
MLSADALCLFLLLLLKPKNATVSHRPRFLGSLVEFTNVRKYLLTSLRTSARFLLRLKLPQLLAVSFASGFSRIDTPLQLKAFDAQSGLFFFLLTLRELSLLLCFLLAL